MKSEDHKDSCSDHYRIQIEVDRCDGFHGAVGVNVHSSVAYMVSRFSSLLLAAAKTDEERAMAMALNEMLKSAFVKSSNGRKTETQKVVPIRPVPPERGPFARSKTCGCGYINGPHLMPGWGCCACAKKHPEGMGTYNGILVDTCKLCGHKCCMPTKMLKAARRKTFTPGGLS